MGFDPKRLTIVYGIGLLHHVEFLLEKHPDISIVIVEPTYKVLEQAVRERDMRPAFCNSKVKLLISNDPKELGQFITQIFNLQVHSGLQFFNLPAYEKIFSNEWEIIKETFRQQFAKFTINTLTIMEAGNEYTENCMRNTPAMHKFPWTYRLFGQFSQIPAIIVSAGPSLHLHLEKLKQINEQAVIIAVDTAYSILKSQGIAPHFVCSADPTSGNFIHLHNMSMEDAYMIVEPMTYHKIVSLEGIKAFMTSFNGYYSRYFAQYAKNSSDLISWGSIASTCFDLARKMQCDPITFIGQDFAYSDFLCHCPKTRFDEKYIENLERNPTKYLYDSYASWHIRRINPLKVELAEDLNGKAVFTSKNMALYANWFEEQFSQTNQTIINASEKGILKHNCKIMKFSEVVKVHMNKNHSIRSRIDEIYKENQDFRTKELSLDIETKLTELDSAVLTGRSLQKQCLELHNLKNEIDKPESFQKIGELTSYVGQNLNCGLDDDIFLQWIDHENQKAELFFKRKIGSLVGSQMSSPMVEELSNHYHGLIESRIVCFNKIKSNLKLAYDSIESIQLPEQKKVEYNY
tara:strand:- start:16551 stop:18275 length:1725 start_codon:yes stop_codon:yes gene_type:complete